MAQSNNNQPNGCANGVLRAFGVALLLGGLSNVFSGAGTGGIIVCVIGVAMLMGSFGKKNTKFRTPVMSVPDRSRMSAEARQHAEKAAEAAERARQLRARQQAAKSRETAKACPNPEPHRHYELPRQPVSNAARMIENRKALYEAGLLTREEYDAEVRKLRGR